VRRAPTTFPVSIGISGHDFGRIAVGPGPRTASPDGMADDYITTANGDAGANSGARGRSTPRRPDMEDEYPARGRPR
jgi:hypothetical protein